ncbi:MAG: MarR family transcriptional regulator, partial [Actinomycetia bacterium]|nr:MarR family transcriptional regulator [Actinomycetes bacterium]
KDNVSIFVMCSLELDGPKRPGEISILTGLSSGGVTKVVSRLEDAGLVTRADHALPQDRRAVTVTLTAKGHELTGRFAHELALRRSETDLLVKELMRLTD